MSLRPKGTAIDAWRHIVRVRSLVLVTAFVVACSTSSSFGTREDVAGEPVTPPLLSSEDASSPDASEIPLQLCPSNVCPAGHATCLLSRFPCDVDLRTDRQNCGACGNACPAATNNEVYECVDGKCEMRCTGGALDCDGLADNGCEVRGRNANHCGACGNVCPPGKPCIQRSASAADIGCGCTDDRLYCNRTCIDPKTDDSHCGECGNACDYGGDGAPMYPNMYYGCQNSQCGARKCEAYWGNCDDVLENGCETSLLTAEHCGACGIKCAEGQECRLDVWGVPQCMCAPGQTFCSYGCDADGVCTGECFDLSSDRGNCGACGRACGGTDSATSVGTCSFGICTRQCLKGWADCNGNPDDYCEVNTDSDPQNCGACGNVCDAIAGQACVGGRCVVEPCKAPDAGELAK